MTLMGSTDPAGLGWLCHGLGTATLGAGTTTCCSSVGPRLGSAPPAGPCPLPPPGTGMARYHLQPQKNPLAPLALGGTCGTCSCHLNATSGWWGPLWGWWPLWDTLSGSAPGHPRTLLSFFTVPMRVARPQGAAAVPVMSPTGAAGPGGLLCPTGGSHMFPIHYSGHILSPSPSVSSFFPGQ